MVAIHDVSSSGLLPNRSTEQIIVTGRTGGIEAVLGVCTELCVLNDLNSGRRLLLASSRLTSQALQTNLITSIIFFSLCDMLYIEPGKTSIVNN